MSIKPQSDLENEDIASIRYGLDFDNLDKTSLKSKLFPLSIEGIKSYYIWKMRIQPLSDMDKISILLG